MTITHCYPNGYTVALDDEGQIDRTNTSFGLLDFDLPESRDAVHAVLADATATIARLPSAFAEPRPCSWPTRR